MHTIKHSEDEKDTIKTLMLLKNDIIHNLDSLNNILKRFNFSRKAIPNRYKSNVTLINNILTLIKNESIDEVNYLYFKNINESLNRLNSHSQIFFNKKRRITLTTLNTDTKKLQVNKIDNSSNISELNNEEEFSSYISNIIESIFNGLLAYLDTKNTYSGKINTIEKKLHELSIFKKSHLDNLNKVETKLVSNNEELQTTKATLTSIQKELKNTNATLISTQEELNYTTATLLSTQEKLKISNTELINNKEKFEKLTIDYENLKSAPTVKVYSDSTDKYRKLEKLYRRSFLGTILFFVILAAISIIYKNLILGLLTTIPNSLSSLIEFWFIKVSIILLGITLASYFLKLSSHYQRLADQSHQTEVELRAYPTFIHDLSPEESAQLRKELALKYFGKDVDGTPHKDLSNLITDQMKSTTELVKATASILKKQ